MAGYASASRIRQDVAELLRPPNRKPLSKTARELLYVEQGNSMVPWDGELVPYMWEPMNCLKSRLYDAVSFVGPARTAKTVSLIDGWIADTIVNDPADFLLVQVSQEKASEFSKKRLDRAFKASPKIKEKLSPRAHDNNIHDKVFKAGNFLKCGWPSVNIFASSDWKRVAITDYDRIDLDIGGEGSAFTLAGKRTQTFMSSGMVLVESSPGRPVTDPNYRVSSQHEAPPCEGILSIYNQGDRRLFYWQCPECGEWFEPDFDLLDWDRHESDPAKASKEVVICCSHCGSRFHEHQRMADGRAFKLSQNAGGVWVPEGCRIDQNRKMRGTPRETRVASFWQKGPTAAFQTWNQLVYKFLAAWEVYERTGSLHDLKVTVNTDQGRPFLPPQDQARSANVLIERQADLGVRVVPSWVRFLTAAVDVQAGAKTARFDVCVIGWGVDLEHVVIDRYDIQKAKRIHPDDDKKFVRVNPATHLEDWDLITERVIEKAYPIDDDSGRRMPILMVACDSAGEDGVTDNAYSYFRKLKRAGLARRFMLIKGRQTGPVIHETYPDNTKRADRKARALGDVPVQLLNVDRLKDTVSASLKRETPGRRYVHFPDWLPARYFDELMAEKRNADGKWQKISQRNETWDLFVYNWAVIHKKKAEQILDWNSAPPWARPINENSELLASSDTQAVPAPRRRRRRSSI